MDDQRNIIKDKLDISQRQQFSCIGEWDDAQHCDDGGGRVHGWDRSRKVDCWHGVSDLVIAAE